MKINAYVGYDNRQPLAYAITVRSLLNHSDLFPHQITPILLPHLQGTGEYNRPMNKKDGQMFDEISEAPMATEFAISRFFIPWLNGYEGWTLFCDSDFLFRSDVAKLFEQIDETKAVMCVKHKHCPTKAKKMDGQLQTLYKRKNWSSMMLINNEHPKNAVLEPSLLNALPGRDLHAFDWLDDEDIGEIGPEWNWLVGHSDTAIDPCAVHFTNGTPDMPGYEDSAHAGEWNAVAKTINLCKDK